MKPKPHIRKLDQSFWIRNTRRLLSSGNQKRYILLIFALVILAGYQVKSQNNTSFNGFELVEKTGSIRKPTDFRDRYPTLGTFFVLDPKGNEMHATHASPGAAECSAS